MKDLLERVLRARLKDCGVSVSEDFGYATTADTLILALEKEANHWEESIEDQVEKVIRALLRYRFRDSELQEGALEITGLQLMAQGGTEGTLDVDLRFRQIRQKDAAEDYMLALRFAEGRVSPFYASSSDFFAISGDILEISVPLKPILVVDDNEINARVMSQRLKSLLGEGITIDTVVNGELAVSRILGNPVYGLILMDKQMPVMDGAEATKQIRQHEREYQITPQYIVSWSADEEQIPGTNATLSKACKLGDLRYIAAMSGYAYRQVEQVCRQLTEQREKGEPLQKIQEALDEIKQAIEKAARDSQVAEPLIEEFSRLANEVKEQAEIGNEILEKPFQGITRVLQQSMRRPVEEESALEEAIAALN